MILGPREARQRRKEIEVEFSNLSYQGGGLSDIFSTTALQTPDYKAFLRALLNGIICASSTFHTPSLTY